MVIVMSDLHFDPDKPERYDFFDQTLQKIESNNVRHVILAGDVFNREQTEFIAFENVIQKFDRIQFYYIRGNHDCFVKSKFFAAENLQVFDDPKIIKIEGQTFCFLPYYDGKTMGTVLKETFPDTTFEDIILISHGDSFGNRDPDEEGYFPILQSEIVTLRLHKVVLGHIHQVNKREWPVMYCGSPWPIRSKETGIRHMLLLDPSKKNGFELWTTEHPEVYWQDSLVFIAGKEEKYLEDWKKKLAQIQEEYNGKRVILNLTLSGYTSLDKQELFQKIKKIAGEFSFEVLSENIQDEVGVTSEDHFSSMLEGLFEAVQNNLPLKIKRDFLPDQEFNHENLKNEMRAKLQKKIAEIVYHE